MQLMTESEPKLTNATNKNNNSLKTERNKNDDEKTKSKLFETFHHSSSCQLFIYLFLWE